MNQSAIICICGAGTMGRGIAQICAQQGFATVLFDVNEAMIEKSKVDIENALQKLVEKEKIACHQKAAILQRICFTSSINDCKADIIIEAIIEQKQAKVFLFNQLITINSNQTIFATNTSSIAVTEIANEVSAAQRVVGMHFFNPATIMKLVEVIKTPATDAAVVDTIISFAKQLGKMPVLCNDAPGFIVNRVARQYYLEAMKLVELGLTDIETIDTIMEASGFKMGPFKLMDMIGLDINYSVSTIVWEALNKPERLHPSVLQQQKVAAGNLGRKTGQGFYNY